MAPLFPSSNPLCPHNKLAKHLDFHKLKKNEAEKLKSNYALKKKAYKNLSSLYQHFHILDLTVLCKQAS